MGKNRLNEAFQKCEKAFVPYIMAGDGGLDLLKDRVQFLEESGATVIELGIPFSDPVADGPTIQEAGMRALKEGTTLTAVLEELKAFKDSRNIPIVLMTYINPIFTFGIEKFAMECEMAGVDGVIVPDLPMEEEDIITHALDHYQIALIRLAAITSPKERVIEIAKRTEGFLYAVTVTGTTGARTSYKEGIEEYLKELKSVSTVPVLAGFGVSTPDHVRQLGQYCDGVVVGSKIIDLFQQGDQASIKELIDRSKERFFIN